MSEELPVSPLDCEDDTDCSPGEGNVVWQSEEIFRGKVGPSLLTKI